MKTISKQEALKNIKMGYEDILNNLYKYYDMDWKKDPNLKNTPSRCARSLLNERCEGLNPDKECSKLLDATFSSNYSGMIIESPIIVNSLCPHHLENIIYKVSIGYIPEESKEKVLGLSKIGRVIKLIGRSLLLQEDFTRRIADILEIKLIPEGIGVIVHGQHSCMIARGLQQSNIWVTTSEMRGSFRDDFSVKNEFMNLLKSSVNKQ